MNWGFERFQLGEIYVTIDDYPLEDYVTIKFVRYINGQKHLAKFVRQGDNPTTIQWEILEEGLECPDNLRLKISRDVARFLFNGFAKILREKNPDKAEAEKYKAQASVMERYIADLRALLFDAHGVEDPTAPLFLNVGAMTEEVADQLAKLTRRPVIDKGIVNRD